jgi:ABC-type uncharacterized transport system involved in gliding motility auxiliary subunit
MGAKTERIEKQGGGLMEQDITNALVKLVKGMQKTIYFTQGHGEKEIDNAEAHGYQFVKNGLEKENYVVKSVNLIQEGKVPADASVLVMAGPTSEPVAGELDAIDAYLNGGGNALLLLDPPPGGASLKDFLKKWSLDVGNNFVVDASGMGKLFGAGPTIPLVTKYEGHRITQGFNVMTFYPLARSISPLMPTVAGITVEPLLKTNEVSWGESDLSPGEKKQVQFDEKTDVKGPVTIAAVATKAIGDKKARLIVFGDSDFAINQYFGQVGNGNLFTNTVSFLAQDENFISIKAKDPANRPVTMTESQEKSVAWLVELLLPASVLVVGISVWVKRRK